MWMLPRRTTELRMLADPQYQLLQQFSDWAVCLAALPLESAQYAHSPCCHSHLRCRVHLLGQLICGLCGHRLHERQRVWLDVHWMVLARCASERRCTFLGHEQLVAAGQCDRPRYGSAEHSGVGSRGIEYVEQPACTYSTQSRTIIAPSQRYTLVALPRPAASTSPIARKYMMPTPRGDMLIMADDGAMVSPTNSSCPSKGIGSGLWIDITTQYG
jgi:hypothetical protein